MQTTRIFWTTFSALALTAIPRFALAEEPSPTEAPTETAAGSVVATPAPETDARATQDPNHDNKMWAITTGFRVAHIPSAGFDPFAKNDVLTSFDLEATRTLYVRDRWSFAVGFGGSMGGRQENARGDRASLTAGRLAVPLCGRYHVGRAFYVGARLAPSVTIAHAALDRGASSVSPSDTFALIGADASLGARFGIPLGPSTSKPRLWIGTDLGYSVTTSHTLSLAQSEEVPGTTKGNVSLGSLSLSGAFFRGNVGVSF